LKKELAELASGFAVTLSFLATNIDASSEIRVLRGGTVLKSGY
jgi:hypothetical protein